MLLPSVRLFFSCAGGNVNEETDTITLVNPIFELHLPQGAQFPFVIRSLFTYINLSGGLGAFRVHVEVSDEEGRLLTKTKPIPVEHKPDNRKSGSDYVVEIPEFKIKKPGVFTVSLFHNYKCIATTEICILNFGE